MAKKITAIALVFLLSAQCLFKLGLITYFEANRDYIAEVLCINKDKPITMCHGTCFLDKNLALADQAENQVPPAGKSKIEIPSFLVTTHTFLISPPAEIVLMLTPIQLLHHSPHNNAVFHPPCQA